MHKAQDKPETAKEVLKFFDWAYDNGDKMAIRPGLCSDAGSLVKLIHAAWKEQIKDAAGKASLEISSIAGAWLTQHILKL